jgi:hypothetical protein
VSAELALQALQAISPDISGRLERVARLPDSTDPVGLEMRLLARLALGWEQ